MPPTSRRFPAIASAFVLTLVLAMSLGACSSGSGSKAGATNAVRLIADSADATTAAGSAKVSMVMTTSGSSTPFMRAEGVTDQKTQSADLTMDISVAGQSEQLRVLTVNGVVYMDFGSALAAEGVSLPGGKAWISIDPKAVGLSTGAAAQDPSQGVNPDGYLASLRGVTGDVTKVGSEAVRGVETTHYKGTLDLAKALDKVPSAERAEVQKSLKTLGTGAIPFEVWIDAQGRLHRLTMTFDSSDMNLGSSGAQAIKGPIALSMELYDYGAPVNVTPPPANETVPFADFLQQMMGALGSSSSQ